MILILYDTDRQHNWFGFRIINKIPSGINMRGLPLTFSMTFLCRKLRYTCDKFLIMSFDFIVNLLNVFLLMLTIFVFKMLVFLSYV